MPNIVIGNNCSIVLSSHQISFIVGVDIAFKDASST